MHCALIAAITLDGFIARHPGERSFDWTSLEDKQFYIQTIKKVGTVIMGRDTFGTFTKYPKGLKFVIYTRNPETFVNPRPEVITTQTTAAEPSELLKELAAEGCQEVVVCGGASIYSQFMKAGVVNKLYLTVEPILFGSGVSLFSGQLDQQLQLVASRQLNDSTLLLEYDVISASHQL